MTKYILSTALEFADRFEGQVLYSGDEDSCRDMTKFVSAVSYSGDETILSSRLIVMPNHDMVKQGQRWVHEKTAEPDLTPETE